ncbi:PKD domain-containing protein, partial [Candidatus Acetothermia bacterium]|nr:PKD domain-containing protein [Candidatus Acetothermia bacterium]
MSTRRIQPFVYSSVARLLVAAMMLLSVVSVGFATWAQTTPKPTLSIVVSPNTAPKGSSTIIRVRVVAKDFPVPLGLTNIQATIQWTNTTDLVPIAPGGNANAITCTLFDPFQNLVGAAGACPVNNQGATGTALFQASNTNSQSRPVLNGNVVEFSFTVGPNANNNDKVTFSILSSASLFVQSGTKTYQASELNFESDTFTVGTACQFNSVDFTVSNSNPEVGQSVTFTANGVPSCVTNPQYTWSFGDGNQSGPGNLPSVSHSYAAVSTPTITLTVRDNTNNVEHTASHQINVKQPACKPTNVTVNSPAKAVVNKKVTFTASATPCQGTSVIFSWSFTNGTGSTTGSPVVHIFTSASPASGFTVTLTATDSGTNGSGGTERATKQIVVTERPSCESLHCALTNSSTQRRKITDFARDNVLPFDEVWDKTNQALNQPSKSLVQKLKNLADSMDQDGKDQFDSVISDVSGTVEAINDGVTAAVEAGDVSATRAKNIANQIERFQKYLDATLPDIMDSIGSALSDLPSAYDDAISALDDNDVGAAVDALVKARSLVVKARQEVNDVLTTVLTNMSRIARSVLAAERLARRRQSGGGISGLMALGTITLARMGDQSLVFRAQGAESVRIELLTLTGRVVLVQQAQEAELTLGASTTQTLA